jgi:hypothetical protein
MVSTLPEHINKKLLRKWDKMDDFKCIDCVNGLKKITETPCFKCRDNPRNKHSYYKKGTPIELQN